VTNYGMYSFVRHFDTINLTVGYVLYENTDDLTGYKIDFIFVYHAARGLCCFSDCLRQYYSIC
jgi:hypothetical protein